MSDDSARTLPQLQRIVHEWISQWEEGYFSPLSNLARLSEEVGELARALNHEYGDKPPKTADPESAIAEELGDILFVVVTLANSLEIDLDKALQEVLDKYNVRDSERFTRKES